MSGAHDFGAAVIWKGMAYVQQSVRRVRWALYGYRKRKGRKTA